MSNKISKEKKNEYQKRWRDKHPETEMENHKRCNERYREKHPDIVKEYIKRYQVKYYAYTNECKRLRNILLIDFIEVQ